MNMERRFVWQDVKTAYREARPSKHGEELRWVVNQETIMNTETGQTVTRGTIRHPGVCVIVPFLDSETVVLMHQYRYAANRALWEVPAGTLAARLENGRVLATESPEACAARELLEETGYRAAELEKICECYAMPGSSDELMHVFFARDLERHEQELDLGEIIEEVRPFRLAEVDAMILRREIRDAKTLVGLFYALRIGKSSAEIRPAAP
jgi:ADP-ribose pyrophosphatase